MRLSAAFAVLALHSGPFLDLSWAKEPEKKQVAVAYLGGYADRAFRDKEDSPGGLACAEHYVGVGFKHSWEGKVTEIQKGGPAWRAGIRIADVMIRYVDEGDRYRFTMKRGNEYRDYMILKDQICMEE